MDYKQVIIDALSILKKRDISEKEIFKARAYEKVIVELKLYPEEITSYENIKNIKGIGENIEKKIKEIIETGILQSAEKAKEIYNIDALDTLQNIYGVGPTKANELVKMGITNIAELREYLKINPKILNDKQKIGLKYYEDLIERIPRIEMLEHEDVLRSLLPDDLSDHEIEIVGSFRRQSDTSGDIDVLIRMPPNTNRKQAKENLIKYVKMLKGFGYIEEILALGEHKCLAISRIYNGKARRLDLLMTADEEYAYSLLYFTGSDKFNVAFRHYALQKGYTLNEYSLLPVRPDIQNVPYMKTEKDIFKFLGLRYIEPALRIDSRNIIAMGSKPKVARH